MGLRPDKVARLGIARSFQNIELFPHMTVLDNLLLGRHVRMKRSWAAGRRGSARQKEELANRGKVEDIIDFLEIEQWRKYPVVLLPYGIQKRVELGRALAMEPELLLLDEPVAGMNLEETEDMARFILDIREELGHRPAADRARHGPGHGHRRPGDGARLRPADRRGHAGRGVAATRRDRRLPR